MLAPVRGNFELQTVNVFSLNDGLETKTFILQGGSDNHWAIAQIVLQGMGNSMQLAGINIKKSIVIRPS